MTRDRHRRTVLGRRDERSAGWETVSPPQGQLGAYRAADGSDGGDVAIDFDRPHACAVVGKRGSGKSHTLGVLGEELARTHGVAPVVVDPMGELNELAAAGLDRRVAPRVPADAIPAPAWPPMLGLDPTAPAGTLIWQAASAARSLAGMREHVEASDATAVARRGARNHLRLADAWDVFDPGAVEPRELATERGVVLDLSPLQSAPANAVCRAVAAGLYAWHSGSAGDTTATSGGTTDPTIPDERTTDGRSAAPTAADSRDPATDPLPWLLVDEAHAFFDGIADPALRTLLTRGRTPGVSLVVATQRPSALPSVAVSQADLLVAHRLTAETDLAALEAAAPTYLRGSLRERLPRERGCAVVIDDATESVHGVRVRDRRTPHGGADPRASERTGGSDPDRSVEPAADDNRSPGTATDDTRLSEQAIDDA